MEIKNLSEGKWDLQQDLQQQCEAMARYAFKQGKTVPGEVVETLAALANSATPPISPGLTPASNTNGQTLSSVRQLAGVHERLTQIVAPASPTTIQLFEKELVQAGYWNFLGPVPLVRRLMGLAGIFLLFILVISISPEVNDGKGTGLFEAAGWPLLMNELFLLCAAGLGATFAALFQLNPYITNGTFDPKYEPGYWIKFVLGLIAGFMLSELIEFRSTPDTTGGDLGRPVLAMVGGFSATVVYRILSKLTETVESLFQGSFKETLAVRDQMAQARALQQLNQDRLKLAAGLIEIQKLAAAGASDAVRQKLDQTLANLIPVEFSPAPVPAKLEDSAPASAMVSARSGAVTTVAN